MRGMNGRVAIRCAVVLAAAGAVHAEAVVSAMPGKLLRLRGGLGPLQAMGVDGSLSIKIEATSAGSQVSFDYAVGGYSPAGFEAMAKTVDQVLGQQADRLKRVIETGHAAVGS